MNYKLAIPKEVQINYKVVTEIEFASSVEREIVKNQIIDEVFRAVRNWYYEQ